MNECFDLIKSSSFQNEDYNSIVVWSSSEKSQAGSDFEIIVSK